MEDLEARVSNKQNDNYEDTHHTFYYIYIVTNLINGKKYIGKRMCHCPIEEDIYFGSGKAIKNALKKYSIDNFKKEILEICKNYQECNEREKYWIKYFNADKDDNFYNIASGGEGGNTYSGLSHEEIERIKKIKSAQTSGKNNPRYGTTWSDETRRKILKALHDYYEKTGLSSSSTSSFLKSLTPFLNSLLCLKTLIVITVDSVLSTISFTARSEKSTLKLPAFSEL